MTDAFGFEHHNVMDATFCQSQRRVQARKTAANDANPGRDAPLSCGSQRGLIDSCAVIADGWSGHDCERQGLMTAWKSTKPTKPIALAPYSCSPPWPSCARCCCGN